MSDVENAVPAFCVTCGENCEPCNNTVTCKNISANEEYLARRQGFGSNEPLDITFSGKAKGEKDFH